jgi:hypothetical protein
VLSGELPISDALNQIRHGRTPEVTATHEAGHAVIARVLGLVCGDASIVYDEVKNHAGVSFSTWQDDAGRKRPERYGRDAEIMTSMAGSEAEKLILGQACDGDGDDRDKIFRLLCVDPHCRKTEARLRLMTRMLVRRHRSDIELVAKTLVAVGTLSGQHIDEWWNAVTKNS